MDLFKPTYISFLFLFFTLSENGFCYGNYFGPNRKLYGNQPNDYVKSAQYTSFSVLNFGAKGDGVVDDTEAFVKTWDAACKVHGGLMLVPAGYTFLLQTIYFEGSSCQPNTVVQVDGKIVAPPHHSKWTKKDFQWIQFKNKNGLIIKGNGVIDGRGESWWTSTSGERPHAVRIVNCSNVIVTGIKIQNPPQMHIFIEEGQYLQIYDFTTSSPADSPNTDGIHLSRFLHADIHNSNLSCGDDCVSVQKGCLDVKIHNVYCGPGHGFSIGGLGPDDTEAEVSDVSVLHSTVQNSLNGVRIKTWPGGSGFVRDVTFSNIKMIDVKTPIVIDQYYCNGGNNCDVKESNAVAISNITYEGLTGTYTYRPVSLKCSSYKPCKDLHLASINLVPSSQTSEKLEGPTCSNAYGQVHTTTTPPLTNCLQGKVLESIFY